MITAKYNDNVGFHPSVGNEYETRHPWGCRTMVLGESHYDTGHQKSDFTQKVVQAVVDGHTKKWRTRLFTKTARLFYLATQNRLANLNECRGFWTKVLYYNFIQDYVGNDPRIRPTTQMWANAANAFEEVVQIHNPRLILVLGKALSQHLYSCPSRSNPRITFIEINHPQSFGWKYNASVSCLRAGIAKPETEE